MVPSYWYFQFQHTVHKLITQMQPTQMEAQDNLLSVKIKQASQENKHRQLSFPFQIGDRAVLSTTHTRCIYKMGDERCIAKFMPCFDDPYPILATDEQHLTVMLALPRQSHLFPVFHTSKIKPFIKNDDTLFTSCTLHPPNPIDVDWNQ